MAGGVEGDVVGFNNMCSVGRSRTETVQRDVLFKGLGVSVLSGNLRFNSHEQG